MAKVKGEYSWHKVSCNLGVVKVTIPNNRLQGVERREIRDLEYLAQRIRQCRDVRGTPLEGQWVEAESIEIIREIENPHTAPPPIDEPEPSPILRGTPMPPRQNEFRQDVLEGKRCPYCYAPLSGGGESKCPDCRKWINA